MKKVLVVDDDASILELMELILVKHGFEVYTHASGLGVPEIVNTCSPDIILLDILLSERLGTEICKELKETYSIPILLFSANTAKEKAYEECNADGFIEKPFDIRELVHKVKSHIAS
jgi:DNA-binding response OmpR family regulator